MKLFAYRWNLSFSGQQWIVTFSKSTLGILIFSLLVQSDWLKPSLQRITELLCTFSSLMYSSFKFILSVIVLQKSSAAISSFISYSMSLFVRRLSNSGFWIQRYHHFQVPIGFHFQVPLTIISRSCFTPRPLHFIVLISLILYTSTIAQFVFIIIQLFGVSHSFWIVFLVKYHQLAG